MGAFRRLAGAESLQKKLKKKGYDVYLDPRKLRDGSLLYRVRIRGYPSLSAAKEDMQRLRGEEGLDSLIVD